MEGGGPDTSMTPTSHNLPPLMLREANEVGAPPGEAVVTIWTWDDSVAQKEKSSRKGLLNTQEEITWEKCAISILGCLKIQDTCNQHGR